MLGVVALLVSLSLNRKAATAAPANFTPATSLALPTLSLATQDIQPVSNILLEVNGIGTTHGRDSEFNVGDSRLDVWSSSAVDVAGYYARAAFDDFSVARH